MDKQKLNCLFFSGLAELTDFFRNATDKSFDILSTSFHRFDVLYGCFTGHIDSNHSYY